MSVFYGVRLTNEMDARIQATGKGKSAVVQEALERYFGGSEEPPQMIIEKAKEPRVTKAKESAIVREKPQAEATPAKLGACPRCGGPTIPWGAMRRCTKCCQNWTP